MVMLVAQTPEPGEAHLFGLYVGFRDHRRRHRGGGRAGSPSWCSPSGSSGRLHRSIEPCSHIGTRSRW
jgi:hypothetical protein